MGSESKVYVVTGALGSIGLAISRGLARTGGTVVLVARDAERANAAKEQLARETGNGRIETLRCDLGSLASVRSAAAELAVRHPRIDALVNNAAAFSGTRKTTSDGFELQFGTNHLAHYLLTRLLEGPLSASGQGRVVVLGMPSKTPIRWDDLQLERGYDGMTAYGMSKAANLLFARELAERWRGRVAVNAVHPGMTQTTLVREAPLPLRLVFSLFASRPEQGADTPVWAASEPHLAGVSGRFFVKRKDTPFPGPAADPEQARRLWEVSERLVGQIAPPVSKIAAGS